MLQNTFLIKAHYVPSPTAQGIRKEDHDLERAPPQQALTVLTVIGGKRGAQGQRETVGRGGETTGHGRVHTPDQPGAIGRGRGETEMKVDGKRSVGGHAHGPWKEGTCKAGGRLGDEARLR